MHDFNIWHMLGVIRGVLKLSREKTWLGSALTAEARTLNTQMRNSTARNAVWFLINSKDKND